MFIVYALTCIETGNAYVGITSGKLGKRFREHKCLAKNEKHTSPKLSQEWKLYGDAAFQMIPLETFLYPLDLEQKRAAESKWLKEYETSGKLLNAIAVSFTFRPQDILLGIEASRHVTGNRWTPEANLKRRLAQLGIPKGHGAKISATKRARQLMR